VIEITLGCARAVFTDRHGGVSSAPFDSMNLAGHVDDDPGAVDENFVRLATRLGLGGPSGWVRPFHVHGTQVVEVTAAPMWPTDADGAATATPGLPLVALGADCAPIALANDTAVAAVHSGWRGALDGVVQAGVAAVRRLGTGPVRAAIGPCICVQHYEFGADALAPLVDRLGDTVAGTTSDGRPALDLPRALHVALAEADVDDVTDLGCCTFESTDHFSYRRDHRTGRQAVVVVKQS
jgi:purine-nucleoside/S-methyl-5'-thioadenosine phosphorylase / adenosine deaminase